MQFNKSVVCRLRSVFGVLVAAFSLAVPAAHAQETVCAKVKIEILQQLTLERQGFVARMKLNNALDNAALTEVDITVNVSEENGAAVPITTDPDDLNAKFYIRVSSKANIDDLSGNGVVTPSSTATIDWLLIPAPGAAGNTPQGKKYLVGATLKYKFAGEIHTLEVSPDVVTVKPMPLLTLDYFLTKDVIGDDPLTLDIEPVEPFTLGVRIKNNGMAVARSVKIESAQPTIVDNQQGLAINFRITGSYVNDAPVANTLLINFGDIAASTSRMGRWLMESTLAGQFTEFSASFTHADELGGALTSLLQATNAHFLIRDVRVDLPGRDLIRDFLAQDGDVLRVYESEGADTSVTDQSAASSLQATTDAAGKPIYRLTLPATQGFVYARVSDPNRGAKALSAVLRSDAKAIAVENVWLSKTKDRDSGTWQYWINIFDANSTGLYDIGVKDAIVAARPPVIQFIPDRATKEQQQVSFLVEASSPDGKAVTLSAPTLPVGAQFTDQGNGRAIFDWTPVKGQAGSYSITFSASDGRLSASRSATILVDTVTPPPGPATPTIDSPLAGAQVPSLKPTLKVLTGQAGNDPTVSVSFEIYADAALTQLIASGVIPKSTAAGVSTAWLVSQDLNDNTWYWWRARAFDGTALYSPWASSRFFANLFNDPPEPFNLTNPAAGIEVASLTPILSLTNSVDRDGDALTYAFEVFSDAALTQVVAQVDKLPPGEAGTTSWTVTPPLTNHGRYYWRAVASDSHDARTQTPARLLVVNIGNTAPSEPVIAAPAVGGQSTSSTVALTIFNSSDAESDELTYNIEIDTVATFDSGNRRASGPLMPGSAGRTAWTVSALVENQRYYWRAKASDGRAESAWVNAQFLMNAVNEAPPLPTVMNPGNASWVATRQPTFEANPVLDPEGDAVRYRFEVYKDGAMTQRVADGVSATPQWTPGSMLADKTTHYWRLRAEDGLGAVSAWSPLSVLYVSTAPYSAPTIALTEPAVPTDGVLIEATTDRQLTIRWEGTDPNIEPTIALYYDRTGSGFAGVLIVDGLKQAAGAVSGSYVWNVSALPTGVYYLYAVIYDAKGVGKAYAPGVLVKHAVQQAGGVIVNAPALLTTSEAGGQAKFTVRLTRAPLKDVSIGLTSSAPFEGRVTPPTLTFTPKNWSVAQTVLVTGQDDCVQDGSQQYQIVLGKALSLDPDYFGIKPKDVNVKNLDGVLPVVASNLPNITICNYRLVGVVTQTQTPGPVSGNTPVDYIYSARLTNTGAPVSGVHATITSLAPASLLPIVSEIDFGAVGRGETVTSRNQFVLRGNLKGLSYPSNSSGFVQPTISWRVTTTP